MISGGLTGALAAGAGGGRPAPTGPPAVGLDQKVIGLLNLAIRVLTVYISAEQDQEDKASVATCIAQLQKVLAKDQAEARQRGGGGGGGGGAPGGPAPGRPF